MVTVSYEGGPGDNLNIFTALAAWLNPHEAVVPSSELFPLARRRSRASSRTPWR